MRDCNGRTNRKLHVRAEEVYVGALGGVGVVQVVRRTYDAKVQRNHWAGWWVWSMLDRAAPANV